MGGQKRQAEPAFKDIYEYDAGQGLRAKLADGWDDLRSSLGMTSIWLTLAVRDFRTSTRKTRLGSAWTVLSTGMTVGVLGYVYGRVTSMEPREAFPYIAAGLILWFFISGCINGGITVYYSARGLIEERALPVSFSVFRFVARYFIELLIKLIVFVIVAVAVSLPVDKDTLLVFPGLLILVATGLATAMLLGPIGARWRDVNELAAPAMLIAFLASPVLWPSSILQANSLLTTLNPFTHFLAVVREPLLGSAPSMTSYGIVIGIMSVLWISAILVHCFTKDRIVFWL